MKKFFISVTLVIATASAILGQTPNKQATKPTTTPATTPATTPEKPVVEEAAAAGGVEQAIMQFENDRVAAVLHNDAAYFERVLADDYIGTGLNGEVTDKAQTIASTKAGDPKLESLSYEDQKVRVSRSHLRRPKSPYPNLRHGHPHCAKRSTPMEST